MQSADRYWTGVPVAIAGQCEIYVGIICASIPSVAQGVRNPKSVYQIVVRKSLSFHDSLRSSGPFEPVTKTTERNDQAGYNAVQLTDRKHGMYATLERA
ncbi:hypothetical protein K504DRAFT_462733 [Pleomassaria siparia CBS 279.74]|uniref:Uncharacterized protein n=1 Tax=Pleomassaria siparia CBS 279.74 TaxID=1314801 RepID=A0A6G1JUZ0_9PLEO|nr:hypothetical protein K504DRAFT_462733 [Pleomassaria siparia CBS 279.74]